MSEYKFKNLSEISTVAEPADGTTMMGFENGIPIQMPMSAVKGSGGVFLIDRDDPEFSVENNDKGIAYGNKVRDALLGGKAVWVKVTSLRTTASANNEWTYGSISHFKIIESSEGRMWLEIKYVCVNGTATSSDWLHFLITSAE